VVSASERGGVRRRGIPREAHRGQGHDGVCSRRTTLARDWRGDRGGAARADALTTGVSRR
jgi:hypothetical protein